MMGKESVSIKYRCNSFSKYFILQLVEGKDTDAYGGLTLFWLSPSL
jgi:hypothetical protein